MDEYKSNSYKERTAEQKQVDKKVKKVATPVKVKKKSEGSKLKDIFISEDASNVKNYVFMDVLVPAIKKAVKDIVTDGIEMILYGNSGRRNSHSTNASYVSYDRFSDGRRDEHHRNSTSRGAGYSYDDFTFKTRGDAEDVLTRMDEIIDEFEVVSVADLYDLVGVTGKYTDQRYGWTNIRNADVVHGRDGWNLRLPKALSIK